jgi:sigma-E factor negative regulatory protein RseC
MIEQQAKVIRIKGDIVFVESLQTSACQSCAQKSLCGSAMYSSLLPRREMALKNTLSLQQGDEVLIGLNESDLLRASLLLYLAPLLVMLIVTSIFDGSDAMTALVAISSLGGTFYLIYRVQAYFIHFFMSAPTLIKKQ